MRGRSGRHPQDRNYLTDALAQLAGWTRDGWELRRTLCLDDTQHAAFTERIKVASDAMQLRPQISRLGDHTQIRLVGLDGDALTPTEVALAARIEDAYRFVAGPGLDR